MPSPVRIIDRYVTIEFLRSWLAALLSFVTIFVVVNLFEKISKFLEYDVATHTILEYYLFMIPYIIKWMNPIAVLLGVLFALGALSRNSEIVAMTASGVSLRRIVTPIVIAGIGISAGVFVFGETVVPYANTKKNAIEAEHIDRRPIMQSLRRINVVYRGQDNHFYYIKVFDGVREMMRDVRIMERDDDGTLVKLIIAEKAVWRSERWRFENGSIRLFNKDGSISIDEFSKDYIEIPETPENFLTEEKEAEDMTFTALMAFVANLKGSGIDSTSEEVELYLKLSVPLANLIVIFIGAPLALTSHRQGMAFGFGIAVILGFGLWGALAVGRALGQNGTLPPMLAAFLPDMIFFAMGLVLLYRAKS